MFSNVSVLCVAVSIYFFILDSQYRLAEGLDNGVVLEIGNWALLERCFQIRLWC